MAINKVLLKDFEPKTNMSFLFDTNIWVFLFCPIADYKRKSQDSSSNFLATLRRMDCEIVVTSKIISEFANVYLRLDYKLWKDETKNFDAGYKKDYVGSDRYIETQKLVENSINQILALSKKYPDEFNSIDINKILANFKHVDFNDAYYSILSMERGWLIFTDDQDYQKLNDDLTIVNI